MTVAAATRSYVVSPPAGVRCTQAGAAQPGVEDERGHDEVGRGVVEFVGEAGQRVRQRHPGVQPVDEGAQVRPEHGRGGPDGRRDGLFESGGAGDRVAQRLGPGGQPFQAAHGGALLARAARQPAPGEHEQHRAHRHDRPAGNDQDQAGGHRGDGRAGGQQFDQVALRPGGAGAQAVQGQDEQEQAAACARAGQQRQRVERERHAGHQPPGV
ncbi:hypothetical protein ACWEPC_03590 [Nonomuraea sp. NPDC004297]